MCMASGTGGAGQPGRTESFRVGVFVHPRLERADVTVRPPDYAGQPEQELQDVRRVSALEGSALRIRFQVNGMMRLKPLYGWSVTS